MVAVAQWSSGRVLPSVCPIQSRGCFVPTHEGRGPGHTPPGDMGGSGANQPPGQASKPVRGSIPSAASGGTWLRGKKSSGRSFPSLTTEAGPGRERSQKVG